MDRPLVSIVTPSYNQAEYIEDTLDSVKNQTYKNIEHIVIDGGSEDGTIEILEAYEEMYNLRWISESDKGQCDAINKGFEQAEGEIVAWINSDDVYFDTGVLERVVEYFCQYDEDIIYGNEVLMNRESVVTSVDVRPDFHPEKLSYRILLAQAAVFFRQKVVKEHQLREDLHYCLDHEYWLRLSQNFSFRHVHDIFAGFRLYESQKSQNYDRMADEFREIMVDYSTETPGPIYSFIDNTQIELIRWGRAAVCTYLLHQNPPSFAFDGQLASLPRMLANIPPGKDDAIKVWHRFWK